MINKKEVEANISYKSLNQHCFNKLLQYQNDNQKNQEVGQTFSNVVNNIPKCNLPKGLLTAGNGVLHKRKNSYFSQISATTKPDEHTISVSNCESVIIAPTQPQQSGQIASANDNDFIEKLRSLGIIDLEDRVNDQTIKSNVGQNSNKKELLKLISEMELNIMKVSNKERDLKAIMNENDEKVNALKQAVERLKNIDYNTVRKKANTMLQYSKSPSPRKRSIFPEGMTKEKEQYKTDNCSQQTSQQLKQTLSLNIRDRDISLNQAKLNLRRDLESMSSNNDADINKLKADLTIRNSNKLKFERLKKEEHLKDLHQEAIDKINALRDEKTSLLAKIKIKQEKYISKTQHESEIWKENNSFQLKRQKLFDKLCKMRTQLERAKKDTDYDKYKSDYSPNFNTLLSDLEYQTSRSAIGNEEIVNSLTLNTNPFGNLEKSFQEEQNKYENNKDQKLKPFHLNESSISNVSVNAKARSKFYTGEIYYEEGGTLNTCDLVHD